MSWAGKSSQFLLIGLENGNLAGWNLTNNNLDYLPAHQGPNSAVSCVENFDSFVISGDRAGRVQVRGTSNYQLFLPEVQLR